MTFLPTVASPAGLSTPSCRTVVQIVRSFSSEGFLPSTKAAEYEKVEEKRLAVARAYRAAIHLCHSPRACVSQTHIVELYVRMYLGGGGWQRANDRSQLVALMSPPYRPSLRLLRSQRRPIWNLARPRLSSRTVGNPSIEPETEERMAASMKSVRSAAERGTGSEAVVRHRLSDRGRPHQGRYAVASWQATSTDTS